MGDGFLHFPPHNSTPALPLEFSFTNPTNSQTKKAHNRPSYPNTPAVQRQNSRVGALNVATVGQLLIKAPKAGPLTSAELSSGTNAFKLRANKPYAPSNHPNNTLLRQEVFKSAHTLAPTSQPPIKLSVDAFPPTRRAVTPTVAPLKPSNKRSATLQSHPSAASIAPSSFRFEPSVLSSKLDAREATVTETDISMDYLDRSSLIAPQERDSSPATSTVADDRYTPDAGLADSTAPIAPPIPPLPKLREHLLAPKTPSRRSIDRNVPTCDCKARLQDLEIKHRELQAQHKSASESIETYSNFLQKERQEKAQTESELRAVESQLAEALEHNDQLQMQVEESHKYSAEVKQLSSQLTTLRQDVREANAVIEQSQAVFEEKQQQLHGINTEYQRICAELEASIRQQQGVSDLLRDELSQVRGNYSESLERNTELQGSLIAMSNEHTETSKSLTALHRQIEDLVIERHELSGIEKSAREQVKALQESVSSLTSDNSRIRSLLDESEQAFAKKLKLLEGQNDSSTRDLKEALAELTQKNESLESLRSAHDETLVHLEVHRREENKAKERVSSLVREVELKDQSLEETRKANESSVTHLAEAERNLNRAGQEIGNLKGRFAEIEKARSVQAAELKTSHSELTKSNEQLLILREKLAEATTAHGKVGALEHALSETKLKLECQGVEFSQLKQQLSQTQESHASQITERDSLLEQIHTSRERETQLKQEMQALRGHVGMHEENRQRASVEMSQAQEHRQVAEQKLADAKRVFEELQLKHKNTVQELTSQLSAQQAEAKRLGNELSACTSAKATLEGVLSNFRASSQQEITALTTHVSDQKVKSSLLEQQIAGVNARCLEHKAEATAHRSDAENARASMALVEHRLKEKDLELGSLRSKVQILEAAAAEPVTVVDPALQTRVSEQELTINDLNTEIAAMKRDAETISERYYTSNLAEPEKEFVTELTTALTQQQNKVANSLRGEVKRKDNEISGHKANIAELRVSLAKQIQRADMLFRQLEGKGGNQDPENSNKLEYTMREMCQLPSSSLSEAPAPDHDEPAPDTPTVPKSTAPSANPQKPSLLVEKQRPQQYRTPAEPERDNAHGPDEILEFEETERARPSGASTRKRQATDIEPADDTETEPTDNRRRGTAKTKKTGRMGDSNVTANTTSARGKGGKRRKA
ncbi:hypothetical protein FRC07_007793 [Ceratobasidium sp. 392]|nr:hypothetical protein FRC07_007793 [Ceratobasidium sp. 392]